jgi:hypothetical protein
VFVSVAKLGGSVSPPIRQPIEVEGLLATEEEAAAAMRSLGCFDRPIFTPARKETRLEGRTSARASTAAKRPKAGLGGADGSAR